MREKSKWLEAYRNYRIALKIEDGGRFNDPKFDKAINIAFNGWDRLRAKRSGSILGHMRRKQRVIESGGYWFGFNLNPRTFNCRCVLVPIVLED